MSKRGEKKKLFAIVVYTCSKVSRHFTRGRSRGCATGNKDASFGRGCTLSSSGLMARLRYYEIRPLFFSVLSFKSSLTDTRRLNTAVRLAGSRNICERSELVCFRSTGILRSPARMRGTGRGTGKGREGGTGERKKGGGKKNREFSPGRPEEIGDEIRIKSEHCVRVPRQLIA